MSRRRGEFEHRTSIFEGAFRAWSHLGGLSPEDVEGRPASELDPLTNPIENDGRLSAGNRTRNPDGTPRREYPYEPLPRSGLAHPYVQAILSPWLGPDADNEAIQLGLTTLRTWWQHRRKGESGSAIAALGTEKMKGVVEGYTRHFFTLAHCLVANDKEQPPRTLHGKMKELDKLRSKRNKKRGRVPVANDDPLVSGPMSAVITADLTDANLTPLERLHAAQRRQLAEQNFAQTTPVGPPMINIKGKCVPGKIDLPGVVDAVTRNATQLAHRGGAGAPLPVKSSSGSSEVYGDANSTPVVYVGAMGDKMIAMSIDGITCAHCVKIVETVLKGCNGNKSPIEGLLDAAADRALNSVLIKIESASMAKRIAFEAARNLAMVGYTAVAKQMSTVDPNSDKKALLNAEIISGAFQAVGSSDGKDLFDWNAPCTCPDTGVLQQDCPRHSQMNHGVFQAFETRKTQAQDYITSSGMQFGLIPDGNEHREDNPTAELNDMFAPLPVDQRMDFFGMEPPTGGGVDVPVVPTHAMAPPPMQDATVAQPPQQQQQHNGMPHPHDHNKAQRNPSVISYSRHMSITSETTFGRAMSGLSALSIDWENLDDFDVEVDHSAHINNAAPGKQQHLTPLSPTADMHGPRRSSMRRSFFNPTTAAAAAAVAGAMSADSTEGAHVTFKE